MENGENRENLENTELTVEADTEENDTVTAETAETVETSETDAVTDAEEETNNYPTQTVLTIRAIVGGYVLYLAYQIITSGNDITPFMWIAVAIFILAGAGLIIMSIKHFICKEYK